MAKRFVSTAQRDLFADTELEKLRPEECDHRLLERTETLWPGDTTLRMTMTCKQCGKIRGRWPGE